MRSTFAQKTNLFHNPRLSFTKRNVPPRLVLDILNLDLTPGVLVVNIAVSREIQFWVHPAFCVVDLEPEGWIFPFALVRSLLLFHSSSTRIGAAFTS